MLADPSFWEEEAEAPLLRRNCGFLTEETAEVEMERAKRWKQLTCGEAASTTIGTASPTSATPIASDSNVSATATAAPTSAEGEDDSDVHPALRRIFLLDAERTYTSPSRRSTMTSVLSSISRFTNDYHQGLGYIVSYLLLLLPPEDVISIVRVLHEDDKYMPGYFKSAPSAFVRDARVFHHLTSERHTTLAQHLRQHVVPEAYCSKWMVGCNVHVLPFKALSLFFDNFFREGIMFTFKFTQSLVDTLAVPLRLENRVDRLLSLLRLDKQIFPDDVTLSDGMEKALGEKQKKEEANDSHSPDSIASQTSFFTTIVDTAQTISLQQQDITRLRQRADTELALELQRRAEREEQLKKEMDEDSDICFTDEEEDEK